MHIAALEAPLAEMIIYLLQKAQIASLKQNENSIEVLSKYINYADVFSFDLAMKLLKNTGINKHAIKLQKDKQSLYRLIYKLGPIKLKTLKIYIKTPLKTGFI